MPQVYSTLVLFSAARLTAASYRWLCLSVRLSAVICFSQCVCMQTAECQFTAVQCRPKTY